MARIVLNTFGSFGDLHPFLAVAIALKNRGHQTVIASSEVYRAKVEAEGVGFAPVRPDLGEMLDDRELLEKVWDPRRGTEYLLKRLILPYTRASFDDLLSASEDADLLVTHSAGFAGPIVAEKLKKRWISAVLQPMAFLSAYDPPVLAPVPWLRHFYRLGQWPFRLAFSFAKRQVRPWAEPIAQLRRDLGLRSIANPFFEGQFSPDGTLALFSRHFAGPQPDWPARTLTTGFAYYDQLGAGFSAFSPHGQQTVRRELEDFLQAGPPPVLFTLGSSAVMHPGNFFRESLGAAQTLGVRAVLLIGRLTGEHFGREVPDSIFLADYAPYSSLMPRVAANVHQGGIGTTAQALLAGKPMLVVPWSHDQPDNAERARKLGVSRTLNRSRYSARTVVRELQHLLSDPQYARKSSDLSERLRQENGSQAAADAIEATLKTHYEPFT